MPQNNKGNLFNIDNIEEAIKAVEEIYNIIHKTGVSAQQWMNDNEKIVAEYNKLKQLASDLFKQDEMAVNARNQKFRNEIEKYHQQIKLNNQQIEQEIQLRVETERRVQVLKEEAELQKQSKTIQKDIIKITESTYKERTRQAEKEYENLNAVQKMLTNKDKWISKRVGFNINQATNYLTAENKKSYEDDQRYLTKTEMKELLESKFGKESDFGKGSSNLSIGSKVLNVASNTLKDAANTILGVFKQGLSNQTNTYENTFSNISVRTGLTRDQYYDNQWELNNQLSSLGLNDNIRSSEVQQMWNSLADTGMSQGDILEQALDNVVTKKIVPYLDTTSQDVNLLNSRLDGNFVKDIRGINKANLDIAGNNYVTQDLLNTIIAQVQPMSDEALQNLTQGSEEMTSYINSLMAKGIDKDTALSYATQYFKAQRYGDQMLSNGTTSEKMFMTSVLQHPELNLYDLNDANNIMGLAGDIDQFWATQLPGYNSSLNGVITNSAGNSVGTSYERMQAGYKINNNGTTFSNIANQTDLTPEQVKQYSNQATQEFTAGNNQTTKELQSITLENFMNELSVTYEKLGLVGDVFVNAIESLGNVILTWLGTKLIGGVIGKAAGILGGSGAGGSGAGVLGGLGTGGVIAAGLATVAAGIATGVKVFQDSINNDINVKDENAQGWYNEAKAQGKSEGASAAQGLLGFHANWNNEHGAVDITKNFNLTSEIADKLGIEKKWNLGSGDEIQEALNKYSTGKDWKAYNKILLAKYLYGSQDADNAILTLLISANLLGKTEDEALTGAIKDITGVSVNASTDFINEMIAEGIVGTIQGEPGYGIASNVITTAGYLKDNGVILKTSDGSELNLNFNEEELKKNFNLHRQGLDYVPEDNYPALLHQGEAVLTASTANELRNLTDTYRETATQSYNIDAIVQNQTSALITKMDEIIRAITTGTSTPETQNTASNKLYNAMLNMQSTKGF